MRSTAPQPESNFREYTEVSPHLQAFQESEQDWGETWPSGPSAAQNVHDDDGFAKGLQQSPVGHGGVEQSAYEAAVHLQMMYQGHAAGNDNWLVKSRSPSGIC